MILVMLNFALYQAVSELDDMNVNYPKKHSLTHVVEDIRAKGAVCHYDTRLGEGEHINVKADYKMSSKKGNVDEQVCSLSSYWPYIIYC